MSEPYYQDERVALYHGDFREVLPALGDSFAADVIVADPPYGETSLKWDEWPEWWPQSVREYASQMWCFGSMRMFLDRSPEFRHWKLSQDVVWEKHNGSSFHADRFKRVHEHALHWYGDTHSWADLYHETPTTPEATARAVRRKTRPPHTGNIAASSYTSHDGGPRLMRSVVYARSMHGSAINETEKPVGLLEPLITYACPPGGLALDPFAGSAATLVAARNTGRRAVGIELRESQCETAAQRLAHVPFDFGEGA